MLRKLSLVLSLHLDFSCKRIIPFVLDIHQVNLGTCSKEHIWLAVVDMKYPIRNRLPALLSIDLYDLQIRNKRSLILSELIYLSLVISRSRFKKGPSNVLILVGQLLTFWFILISFGMKISLYRKGKYSDERKRRKNTLLT